MTEILQEAMGEHVLLGKPTDADKLAQIKQECFDTIERLPKEYQIDRFAMRILAIIDGED